ncbi:OLC1v1002563C1 [Oldenlandia corymbosa var. corymbosa]|uniref:ribonuclease P n=1 Tax=Oldenlandia corymbosa var. corymbosa TaxID=529605 RepID=A0AAV1D7Z1_OLDCO|nr:OLC1v1002563C1 [Oldenlandia corymbosa var. corymbosa]
MGRMALLKTSSMFSLFRKTPVLLHNLTHEIPRNYFVPLIPILNAKCSCFDSFPIKRAANFCTISASRQDLSSPSSRRPVQVRHSRKARREDPEFVLRFKLNACSERGDLEEALRIYDEARANNIQLNVQHYNSLLYLCTARKEGDCSESNLELDLQKGFEIFEQMGRDNVAPNEATFTSAARLAAAKKDPDMAFQLVKQMKSCGIVPKLRSYGPALLGFCEKLMADKAYEVDAHMVENGVFAEEPELSALLKLSSEAKIVEKVYEMMHRVRMNVRQVSEGTATVVEDWFTSEGASEVGLANWDVEKVKEGMVKGGGGWHGQGWLGKGKWRVVRTEIMENGVCSSCGEKLVSIDIDPEETENFANSVAKLASEREVKADFMRFQKWLEEHGPFDAVVDGANLALTHYKNFNLSQLKHIVNRLRKRSKSNKLPLVILHRSRVFGGPAQDPSNKKLLESWNNAGALYATPLGSNDDWYWLYAAVKSKCLLVTNDEMRDHLFQLLGTSFFPRWKEKHQVRTALGTDGKFTLRMPPKYSIVIQESEQGSWHVPIVTGDDLETPRKWICATRSMVVNPDGTGNYTTINAAIAAAPNNTKTGQGYHMIRVVAEVYQEYVTIASNKKYLMMVGDGINQTIITGNHSVDDGWTTYDGQSSFSPLFLTAADGPSFIGVNFTIRNTAGAAKHQAGTVDYIFGNAAVVFQQCNIYSRLPLKGQFNTITAHGKSDINQNTGTSIHNCNIKAADDLATSNTTTKTYLGRPWKTYSTTIVMESFMDTLINPAGWSIWSVNQSLDTLYHAEYNNTGPGSNNSNRVTWTGYHILINGSDVQNVTVSNFLAGDFWLPSTGFRDKEASSSSSSVSSDELCDLTPFPDFCRSQEPVNTSTNIHDFGRLSFQKCLTTSTSLLYSINVLENSVNSSSSSSRTLTFALQDCQHLLSNNIEMLSNVAQTLQNKDTLQSSEIEDVETWLSAIITNKVTCLDGLVFADSSSPPSSIVKNLSPSLVNGTKLLKSNSRKLSQISNGVSKVANTVVVNPDGSGDYQTISAAIAAAPSNTKAGRGYYQIRVVAGVYQEYITIDSKKTYLMMVGDGINKTIITGSHSVGDGWSSYGSATFAVEGHGFVGRDFTIRNTAGAAKGPAVALRNAADKSTFYKCSFEGYQDTLLADVTRQFFRECDIYGTADYIFGNAAVVFQGCNIYSRRPLPGQFNAITAQGKSGRDQLSGISLHNCNIKAAEDLGSTETYLGRPWKEFARTVVMESFIDGLINPAGWREMRDVTGFSSSLVDKKRTETMKNHPQRWSGKGVEICCYEPARMGKSTVAESAVEALAVRLSSAEEAAADFAAVKSTVEAAAVKPSRKAAAKKPAAAPKPKPGMDGFGITWAPNDAPISPCKEDDQVKINRMIEECIELYNYKHDQKYMDDGMEVENMVFCPESSNSTVYYLTFKAPVFVDSSRKETFLAQYSVVVLGHEDIPPFACRGVDDVDDDNDNDDGDDDYYLVKDG